MESADMSAVAIYYHFAKRSRNKKTGPIPVTTTSRATCWDGCPLFEESCYAEVGFHSRLHWDRVDRGERGGTLEELCASVSRLPLRQLWRHNQAGDLPGESAKIDVPALAKIVQANRTAGARGFTYTHKPVLGDDPITTANRHAIWYANAKGFTINLSGNDLAHADELAELDIGPVVVLLPTVYQRKHKGDVWLESLSEYRERLAQLPKTTPAGRRVPVCPATYLDNRHCGNCGLCAVRDRKSVVGFPGHGIAAQHVNLIAMGGADHATL